MSYEGRRDEDDDGVILGVIEGRREGREVTNGVGTKDGAKAGLLVKIVDARAVGEDEGTAKGAKVGLKVGVLELSLIHI